MIVCISHYYFIPMYLHYKIIEFDWSAHFVTYLSEVRTFRLDLANSSINSDKQTKKNPRVLTYKIFAFMHKK